MRGHSWHLWIDRWYRIMESTWACIDIMHMLQQRDDDMMCTQMLMCQSHVLLLPSSSVIHHPMDLDTIHKQLNALKYQSRDQFINDMLLVVYNCKTYNTPSTTYYRCAEQLEECIQKCINNQGWNM